MHNILFAGMGSMNYGCGTLKQIQNFLDKIYTSKFQRKISGLSASSQTAKFYRYGSVDKHHVALHFMTPVNDKPMLIVSVMVVNSRENHIR